MAEELRPIETCPNGHRYNTWKYGDTCPVCGAKIADKEKTPEEWKEILELPQSKWICGLLVCVGGINKGRFYAIHEGKNYIGSDPNMDICIRGDKGICPKNHAVVLYDPREGKAMMLAGESTGLIYVKNKALYIMTDIEPLSLIQMGNSWFFYQTFCTGTVKWEEFPKMIEGAQQ